jgi:RNA polymerase sigma-70 factor (ECF subfamily)
MALTDNEAIALSLSDPEQFVTLFDRHGFAVHAYLTRRAGRQSGEDLAADVWLRAFRARHTYATECADARPWLYGIARNTLRAFWRFHSPDGKAPVEPAHDPWPDVDGRLDASSQLPMLRAALARLSDGEREVLLLVAWEQLTPTEVAVALNLPAGTVRWRLHHARHTLMDLAGLGLENAPTAIADKEA